MCYKDPDSNASVRVLSVFWEFQLQVVHAWQQDSGRGSDDSTHWGRGTHYKEKKETSENRRSLGGAESFNEYWSLKEILSGELPGFIPFYFLSNFSLTCAGQIEELHKIKDLDHKTDIPNPG